MISFALATALAAAQAGPLPQPRKAFAACLSSLVKAKMSEKLDDGAFRAAAKTACAAQEAAFRDSIVSYDVRTGMKRAAAEEGAELQVEDYLVNAAETYQLQANPKVQ